ncbi:hypothetical protein ABPG75_005522 [Micractinium tetrahymenae]
MLSGKVAVVTGAASGIGEAAARLFVKEGARVVLGDIQEERLAKLIAELGGPRAAVARRCDVREEQDVQALVASAEEAFGQPLDIMVANAGIVGRTTCPEARMELMDFEGQFDREVQTNLRGTALSIKHAGRAMKAAGRGGCIINVASVASFMANCSTSGDPALITAGYGASKAGVVMLTKLGACELRDAGIRVNAVAPGYTATPMVAQVLGMSIEDTIAYLAKTSPLPGVAILPEDIAQGMLYLASDMARCVNGHTLVIDCGLVAGVPGSRGERKDEEEENGRASA